MRLSAQVERGRLIPDSISDLVILLQAFEGQRVTVEIEREQSIRSLKANRRYRGVLLPLAKQFLNKTRDIPLSDDQVHYVLKGAFAGMVDTPLGPVPKKTRDMTQGEFADFQDEIQAWLGDNAIPVPEPGEAVEVEEGA